MDPYTKGQDKTKSSIGKRQSSLNTIESEIGSGVNGRAFKQEEKILCLASNFIFNRWSLLKVESAAQRRLFSDPSRPKQCRVSYTLTSSGQKYLSKQLLRKGSSRKLVSQK